MHSREIRQGFLSFFEQQGHRIVPSSPLVPADDPTLLFTNAGMNQFKDLFLGKEKRDYRRATTSQKCMRVSGKHNDLDNVGPSLRHHTFFEMLGNFSFGDYFKADAIAFAWTLITEVWKLPADTLIASIFKGENGVPRDDEAYEVWRKFLPADRIVEYGAADNFWQMGDTGPCGRCSEIYYQRADGEIEIWNNVFMEFDRSAEGTLAPLPAPSIDTGMGLERIAAVIQGKVSNYDTDLFQPLLGAIGHLTGHRYGAGAAADVSMRVVADHMRASTFLIGDGVVPSNEWRGYVLRKIMRRAMRHGKKLGATEPFLHQLVDVVVSEMGDAYPDLRGAQPIIARTVRAEEDRFDAVLTSGLARLEDILDRASAGSKVVAGDDVFRLYDSLGVPVDFVEDLAGERGLAVDREGFERAMAGQREKGRAASAFESKRAEAFAYASDAEELRLLALGDAFEGYTTTTVRNAHVAALFDAQRRQVDAVEPGAQGFIVLTHTPFYVESGGQVSDTGRILGPASAADVEDMTRLAHGGPRAHLVHVVRGRFAVGDVVTAEVNIERRDSTRRNHTATHLLHAALRQVLGAHVKQAGSLVAPDRLRFDFQHFAAVGPQELTAIERLVNSQIVVNAPVETEVKDTQTAIAGGAMALFGEKYGEQVRVVSIPSFSQELCGGTHCRATGDIGLFTIVAEGGVAAGVRRIEALTGSGAFEHYHAEHETLTAVLHTLNAAPGQAVSTIERLQSDLKRLTRELQGLRVKAAMGGARSDDEVVDAGGVPLIARRLANMDKTALRTLSDQLRDRLKSGVVVLAADNDGKVSLVVAVTKDVADKVPAGQVVKRLAPIVGGGGGGRADFAEAGGKDPSQIDALLAESRTVVAELAQR